MAEELNQEALIEEIENFRKEKERIRHLVGQIGGAQSEKRNRTVNIIFIAAMGVLFVFDLLRHIFKVEIPLPQLFSIELAVLLVSVKIIWMIHRGDKVEHFQFWVLNSIEFRLNDISRHLREIDKRSLRPDVSEEFEKDG